ncbi:MAG: type I methionyl aminopeptidase [Cytophagales bacterium]|nr:type I methionyl aminopeptidase [Cytophagales bacterium]
MENKVILKTAEDIARMKISSDLVSRTLGELQSWVKEGNTPLQLDKIAETYIRDHGAVPAFLGLYDFPNTLCISRNEEIVHGIPSHIPFKSGDIVSIDCGVQKDGFCGDQAYTFIVEETSEENKRLIEITKTCLERGIEAFQYKARLGDVGFAIQSYAEEQGCGVVKELVGHGIGKQIHEAPEVPNFGQAGQGKIIQEGWVVAIEPMITLGNPQIRQAKDGWTLLTRDGKNAAHFEHNIAILDKKPQLLSSFAYIDQG